MTTFDLRSLKLRSGDQFVDRQDVRLEPLELGGQRYLPVPEEVPAELKISRASTGTVFQLGFVTRLHGPCYRCLTDATLELSISVAEYEATSPGDDEELRNAYLADEKLNLSSWARDAIALALPDKILCRTDCAGLCPVCGKDLNFEPHAHVEAVPDSRWSALAALRDRL